MLFTPISNRTGKRLEMEVKPYPRHKGQMNKVFYVEEIKTGKIFKCRVKACEFPNCLCDALIYD